MTQLSEAGREELKPGRGRLTHCAMVMYRSITGCYPMFVCGLGNGVTITVEHIQVVGGARTERHWGQRGMRYE